MNKHCQLIAENVHFAYHEQNEVISNVSFVIQSGQVFGIYGKNGSGKSTLLKILGGIIHPMTGSVLRIRNNQPCTNENNHKNIGYVAPYISLYDEFTLRELTQYMSSIRGMVISRSMYEDIIEKASLVAHADKQIKSYSSGMQQRVKLILAILHSPDFLFLDEPTSNLDDDGIAFVHEIIQSIQSQQGIICIATNEEREKSWCNSSIDLLT